MIKQKIKILGISGSLRSNSSASAILNVVSRSVPAQVEFTIYKDLAEIPAFDDSNEIPGPVADFIKLLSEADGVFFVIPEYAFGVPGALKNALDWTVGTSDFVNKPVALVTASSVGDKAHASLLQTLTAISADIVKDGTLLISFVRSKLNEKGEVSDAPTLQALQKVFAALVETIRAKQQAVSN